LPAYIRGIRYVSSTRPTSRSTRGHAVKEAGGDDGVDMMRGWGDVEFIATDHRVPTIYFGPGTVAAAHTADEYIDLDRYHMGVTVYEGAIQEFLGTS
jgi:acetylornithine deacetylase/succinyl-diaminopimelate desuccinylase-like protein